jgi:hypothetical protein
MLRRSNAAYLLIFTALALTFIAALFPPIPQPLSYHNFADIADGSASPISVMSSPTFPSRSLASGDSSFFLSHAL